jgi:hypothetical protein
MNEESTPPLLKGKIQWADDIEEVRRKSRNMQPCRRWIPLRMLQQVRTGTMIFEQWQSDIYDVTVRRREHNNPLKMILGETPWIQIGISNLDGSARHDWRDMQRIKNQLCGPEWEAVELFPAESRLKDPSNFFILWAFPLQLPIGMRDGRRVESPKSCIAPQRGWLPGDEPEDLKG